MGSSLKHPGEVTPIGKFHLTESCSKFVFHLENGLFNKDFFFFFPVLPGQDQVGC